MNPLITQQSLKKNQEQNKLQHIERRLVETEKIISEFTKKFNELKKDITELKQVCNSLYKKQKQFNYNTPESFPKKQTNGSNITKG